MFLFPNFFGKIATEYDESYSLLQMVGNLMRRVHDLEDALSNSTSVINLLSSKLDNLTMSTMYLDNSASIIIDIDANKQYVLRNTVEHIKLTAKHYIHDCNCDECKCDSIKSKDNFICEINCKFDNNMLITDIIDTDGFELAWCNDTEIDDTTNATIVVWWDGSRFCAALGAYDDAG